MDTSFSVSFKFSNIPNDISFPNREEFKYTKADLLDHFGFLNNKIITHTAQYWSFFLAKQSESKNFYKGMDRCI